MLHHNNTGLKTVLSVTICSEVKCVVGLGTWSGESYSVGVTGESYSVGVTGESYSVGVTGESYSVGVTGESYSVGVTGLPQTLCK